LTLSSLVYGEKQSEHIYDSDMVFVRLDLSSGGVEPVAVSESNISMDISALSIHAAAVGEPKFSRVTNYNMWDYYQFTINLRGPAVKLYILDQMIMDIRNPELFKLLRIAISDSGRGSGDSLDSRDHRRSIRSRE